MGKFTQMWYGNFWVKSPATAVDGLGDGRCREKLGAVERVIVVASAIDK